MVQATFVRALVCGLLFSWIAHRASAADWRGFLGANNAYSASDRLPAEFTVSKDGQPASGILWRTELDGRAVSGPIVVADRVYVTSSSGIEQRWCETSCLSANSGDVLWSRKLKAAGRPYSHPTSANAAPTPCSDGQYVFGFFSSNDLVCFDLDGNLKWYRGLGYDNPKAGNDVGMSSSPVVVGGVVVVQSESQGDSFATGVDVQTGATLWQLERPHKPNWASPCVARGLDGQAVVILQSSQDVVAVDPRSGSEVWTLDLKCSSVPSTVATDGKLFIPAGGLKAFELARGLEAPKLLWQSSAVNPSNASPVVTDKGVLAVKGSILAAVNFDGKLMWQIRLGEIGQVWSSPVVADDKLVVFGMNGKCVSVDLSGDQGKVLATSELGEDVLGSPALADNAMFVRSVSALWKIGAE